MIKKRSLLLLFNFHLFLGSHLVQGCGVDWKIPANHFDGVNETGKLSLWESLGKLPVDDNLTIPLVVNFSPANGYSPYLGDGWTIPLLESKVVQIDERKFLLIQPDGITRQFWRSKPDDLTLKGQGNWAGEISGSVITLWASCGWKLTFREGKLGSIKTPQNKTLTLHYKSGRVSEIQEDGREILRVNDDPGSGEITGITYGKNHIDLKLAPRPIVQVIQGHRVVQKLEKSLHSISPSDGSQITYNFEVDKDVRPLLKTSDKKDQEFVWDPVNGQIVTDGQWTYSVIPGDYLFANSHIERTNSQGQSESWFYDSYKGIRIEKNITGITTTTQWFASGPAKGKLRQISQKSADSVELVTKFSYDDMGRLIRRINPDSQTTRYEYDQGFKYVFFGSIRDGDLYSKTFTTNGKLIDYTKLK
jgi:hypothetical protein